MASAYPAGLDSFATNKADATVTATDHPGHHNDLADAVNKIEAELGINPSGASATVAALLTTVPQHVLYLGGRMPDETVHIDDKFYPVGAPAAVSGGTAFAITGTASWLMGRQLLSAIFDDQSTGDLAGYAYTLTSPSAPRTVETAVRIMPATNGSPTVGLGFTNGTASGSTVAWIAAFHSEAAGSVGLNHRAGTLTDSQTTNNVLGTVASRGTPVPLYLRFVWEAANTFSGSFSLDGVTYRNFGGADITPSLTPTHAVLIVGSAAGTVESQATFHYLRVYNSALTP